MTRYLKLDGEEGRLTVVSQRPLHPYVEFKQPQFFNGKFGVFHNNFPQIEQALARIQTLSGCADYIKAAQYAALQLVQMYDSKGTLFVSLGASPKIIKWALDCYGFKVANVSASSMSELPVDAEPTGDFIAYVTRKVTKEFIPDKIVLMDFADTGKSLRIMRNMLLNYVPITKNARVVMVATGTGGKYVDEPGDSDDKIKPLPGYVVDTHLKTAFSMEMLKNDWFGRMKGKNDYATWTTAQSKSPATSTMEKARLGHFTAKVQHELYSEQKDFIKHVMRSKETAPVIYGNADYDDDEDERLNTSLEFLSGSKGGLNSKAYQYADFVPPEEDEQ